MNLLLEYIRQILEAENDKTLDRLNKIYVVDPKSVEQKGGAAGNAGSKGSMVARSALASYAKGKPYGMKRFVEPFDDDKSSVRYDSSLMNKIISNLGGRLGDAERRGLQKLLKNIEADALPSKSQVQNKSSKGTKPTK